jgi:hypothetical protein
LWSILIKNSLSERKIKYINPIILKKSKTIGNLSTIKFKPIISANVWAKHPVIKPNKNKKECFFFSIKLKENKNKLSGPGERAKAIHEIKKDNNLKSVAIVSNVLKFPSEYPS